MSLHRVAAAVVAAVCWLAPAIASASPPFELSGSLLGSGGLNARASGADASSAYFNPARLSRAKPGLGLGWFVLNDAVDLTLLARDPAVDVPVIALNEFEGKMPALPTEWLERGCDPAMGGGCVSKLPARPRQSAGTSGKTRVYQVFGLVSQVVDRYFTLGLYGMMPFDAFMQGNAYFVDEREQYFSNSLHAELYSDRLSAMAISGAASSQVTDWLSLGVGVTLSLTNSADATTFVGNSAQISETLQLATKIKVSIGLAPIFGAVITPTEGLEISLTAHAPQKLEIETAFGTFLPNGDMQRAKRTATLAYEPWKFGLGTQYDFVRSPEHLFGAVVTATYGLWSNYVSRQSERPQQGYGWADTLGFSLGLRHVFMQRLSSGIDASYEPSPVPLQTGRTNYVDNDRYGIAGSVSYLIPFNEKMSLRIGLQAQLHILPERTQRKVDPKSPPYTDQPYSQIVQDEWVDGAVNNRDEVFQESFGLQTNNPGWPGFSSQGTLLGGGLNLTLNY